jgi:hypothetical protein
VGLSTLERIALAAGEPTLPAPTWERFGAATIAAAASVWTARAAQERRSAAVFATISGGLSRLPLPLPLLGAVARIASDELRHTELCRRVAMELGAGSFLDDLTGTERRLRMPDVDPATAVASLLLVEGAVGETISTALFAATREATVEPRSRAALSSILKDEARHARTCWAAFEVLAHAMPLDGARLAADLSRELGLVERETILPALRRVEAGDDDPLEFAAVGVLRPLRRAEVFYSALEGKVLPRVTALGIDGETAWADRYRHVD